MVRALCGALVIGFFTAATAALPARAADEGKCTIATKGDNDVVKACEKGGIKRAKTVMKAMQKLAKEKGMKVDCDSCHKNETDWALTDDAQDQFKKMVALTKA